jgi:3-phenylpropionate/trans-cinnamate dioxygenase ferredoxin reductase component
MSLRSIAVIGASLAGKTAAAALRRSGFTGRLLIAGDEPCTPYDRPPLSKEFLRGERTVQQIALREDAALTDIDWRLGQRATALDAASRTVGFDDGRREAFDGIVIATGARPRKLPGSELAGVHVLRTVTDAQSLRSDLAKSPARVVIVGAGFIGQEVAATCIGMGLGVTMIELGAPAAHVLGPAVAQGLTELHRARGVDLRLGVSVHSFEGDGLLRAVRLSDGTLIDAQVALLGVGVIPNTEWLAGSGLTIADGVLCDETCLAAPGIVAAGDVARWPNPRYGHSRRVEHWDNAVRQAEHAAARLLAADEAAAAKPYNPVPWFWSDQYSLKLQLVGSTFAHDEARIVEGSAAAGKFIALYRKGEHLSAALTIANTSKLLKYRRSLENTLSWVDALAMAA